ncbi:MAG: hypothetical protein JW957_00980 [Candidatus Omnitrophica bacterium]|nr:hypothetical protein [Candidatus Omnitrophota bacterium]
MKINHIIFLIHPGIYEMLNEKDPESIRSGNYGLCLEREREIRQRWLDESASLNAGTLLLQLYGSVPLNEIFKGKLGEANVCYVRAEVPSGGFTGDALQREYHRRLTECIRSHMERFGLAMDAETITSEIWGQSFEGCAPGYASAFAENLQLKAAPRMRFEMTGYDSCFLYGAKRWESARLNGTDIEVWLFECYDGTAAAIFQARLHAQWLDKRPIRLQLNPSRLLVCNKRGHTVWPLKPFKKGDDENPCAYQLTTSDSYWVRSVNMNFEDFRKVVTSAAVAG